MCTMCQQLTWGSPDESSQATGRVNRGWVVMKALSCSLCLCRRAKVEETIAVFLSYRRLDLYAQVFKQLLQLRDRQALNHLQCTSKVQLQNAIDKQHVLVATSIGFTTVHSFLNRLNCPSMLSVAPVNPTTFCRRATCVRTEQRGFVSAVYSCQNFIRQDMRAQPVYT